jgi:hypothetical protein
VGEKSPAALPDCLKFETWRQQLRFGWASAFLCGKIHVMTVQTFREMLGRRPFQPVKLTLSSGQSYEIRHPEMALLTRTSILVGTDLAEDGVPANSRSSPCRT